MLKCMFMSLVCVCFCALIPTTVLLLNLLKHSLCLSQTKNRESKSREKVLTKLKSKHKPQVPPPCLVLRFLKSNITS